MDLSLFSRQSLGFFPTPLHPLSKLTGKLGGAELFIKRDDLTGLALGGNKTRKLEYILGEAVAEECDTVITAGAIQSNHCRQTAAAAALVGLDCHLMLGGQEPESTRGNLLLDKLFRATIHWAGDNRKGEGISDLFAELSSKGKKPYVVPYGGSNVLGALGYVNALRELTAQMQKQQIEPFTHVVFASSSGGTHAGLLVGKQAQQQSFELIGIKNDKTLLQGNTLDEVVLELANATASTLKMNHCFDRDDVVLNDNYLGDGYGVVGQLEREAINLMAETEGILLDPVYTGRAMGGLIDLIRARLIPRDARVLFWHTGGAPALFAYPPGDIMD